MKKTILLLIVASSSVSFNFPVKKKAPQEAEMKKENLNMLLISYKIAK